MLCVLSVSCCHEDISNVNPDLIGYEKSSILF